jgi:tetraacyldisaccharide 4'-kinase
VLIGPDRHGATATLPPRLPVLAASLQPGPEIAAFVGRRALAFAGIGRPEKFFTMLESTGVTLAARFAFPDHHRFSAAELSALVATSAEHGAMLVTTPKDAARLAPADRARVSVIGVRLAWADEAALEALLAGLVP